MRAVEYVNKFLRAKGGGGNNFKKLRLVTWTQASFRPPQIFGQVYATGLLYTMYISKRSGMDHTVLPANTPCLPFLRMRSPDGATSN